MKYMLDTNICSYIIKNRPIKILNKFKTLEMDDCCISSITYAELKYWIAKNKRLHLKSQNQGSPKINGQLIDNFTSHLDVIDFDASAADVYADIRDSLESKGLVVGNMDMLIGAHAISLGVTLVTNNTKDFAGFPGVLLENWLI